MLHALYEFWPQFIALTHLTVAVLASCHAVLHKEDTRATIGWVGLIWLTPLLGTMLYVCFGINRIQRKAQLLRGVSPTQPSPQQIAVLPSDSDAIFAGKEHLRTLAHLVAGLTNRPLLTGNRVVPLINGDEAYPVMLTAIAQAQSSVTLCTYLFDNDRAGREFLEALRNAVERGVAVRVLIDHVGARYTWPTIVGPLKEAGIRVATFLPTLVPGGFRYSNLRNHRKVLVVDGRLGFAGGMNISEANLQRLNCPHPVQDLHFRLEGPVVRHLQESFADDWNFATGETLSGPAWFPEIPSDGPILARGISDGPDIDFDKLRLTLLGAINVAQSSIRIITPYFLPDEPLMLALDVAALRGVEVDIILPEENNLPPVKWASQTLLPHLLERGCRLWSFPPPFAHTKLVVVDDLWVLLGSANWDPRSFRLNFEFNVECYNRELAAEMNRVFENHRARCRAIELPELQNRSLLLRLRDGITRLAIPYL